MAEIAVPSLDDPRLDPYRRLTTTNLTRWSGQFIAEGIRVVERLLRSGWPVESILVSQRRRHLLDGLPVGHVDLLVLPDDLAHALVGFNFHAGVLACGRRVATPSLEQILAASDAGVGLESPTDSRGQECPTDSRGPECPTDSPAAPDVLIACPRMTDPGNLGGLIRIGRALGARALLLGPACADPFSRRVIRVSMGTVFEWPVVECADLAAQLDTLRDAHGFRIAATLLDPYATPLHAAPREPRLVVLFGNEAEGLEPEWIDRADVKVTIPMSPGADSLNVTVAAGIILHHFTSP